MYIKQVTSSTHGQHHIQPCKPTTRDQLLDLGKVHVDLSLDLVVTWALNLKLAYVAQVVHGLTPPIILASPEEAFPCRELLAAWMH